MARYTHSDPLSTLTLQAVLPTERDQVFELYKTTLFEHIDAVSGIPAAGAGGIDHAQDAYPGPSAGRCSSYAE